MNRKISIKEQATKLAIYADSKMSLLFNKDKTKYHDTLLVMSKGLNVTCLCRAKGSFKYGETEIRVQDVGVCSKLKLYEITSEFGWIQCILACREEPNLELWSRAVAHFSAVECGCANDIHTECGNDRLHYKARLGQYCEMSTFQRKILFSNINGTDTNYCLRNDFNTRWHITNTSYIECSLVNRNTDLVNARTLQTLVHDRLERWLNTPAGGLYDIYYMGTEYGVLSLERMLSKLGLFQFTTLEYAGLSEAKAFEIENIDSEEFNSIVLDVSALINN